MCGAAPVGVAHMHTTMPALDTHTLVGRGVFAQLCSTGLPVHTRSRMQCQALCSAVMAGVLGVGAGSLLVCVRWRLPLSAVYTLLAIQTHMSSTTNCVCLYGKQRAVRGAHALASPCTPHSHCCLMWRDVGVELERALWLGGERGAKQLALCVLCVLWCRLFAPLPALQGGPLPGPVLPCVSRPAEPSRLLCCVCCCQLSTRAGARTSVWFPPGMSWFLRFFAGDVPFKAEAGVLHTALVAGACVQQTHLCVHR
jgi:hypothetical protein